MVYFGKLFYTSVILGPRIYLVHDELPSRCQIFKYNFFLKIFLSLSVFVTIEYSVQIRTIERVSKSIYIYILYMYLADLCSASAIHINVQ